MEKEAKRTVASKMSRPEEQSLGFRASSFSLLSNPPSVLNKAMVLAGSAAATRSKGESSHRGGPKDEAVWKLFVESV